MTELRAVVIGASSGIGRELARIFAREGYEVGITARRRGRLETLAEELQSQTYIRQMDVSEPTGARMAFKDLISEMGNVDVVVLCAGIGPANPDLEWEPDRDTIETNVMGFVALATAAMNHFESRDRGHLVGISSLAGIRGHPTIPAYSASKAFVSKYLEGLRVRTRKQPDITVTAIEPGFVDTAMAEDAPAFAASSPTAVAEQSYDAIVDRLPHAYVTRRWRPVAWLMRLLPDRLYARFLGF